MEYISLEILTIIFLWKYLRRWWTPEVLDRFNCQTRVHAMNIYSVVLELAKRELIQKPHIMVCSWSKLMHKLRSFPEFCCFNAVHQYHSSANPTHKAIISLLDVEPKSNAERDCVRFLQRYILGLDKSQLIIFLWFTRWSDIISVDKITGFC